MLIKVSDIFYIDFASINLKYFHVFRIISSYYFNFFFFLSILWNFKVESSVYLLLCNKSKDLTSTSIANACITMHSMFVCFFLIKNYEIIRDNIRGWTTDQSRNLSTLGKVGEF